MVLSVITYPSWRIPMFLGSFEPHLVLSVFYRYPGWATVVQYFASPVSSKGVFQTLTQSLNHCELGHFVQFMELQAGPQRKRGNEWIKEAEAEKDSRAESLALQGDGRTYNWASQRKGLSSCGGLLFCMVRKRLAAVLYQERGVWRSLTFFHSSPILAKHYWDLTGCLILC